MRIIAGEFRSRWLKPAPGRAGRLLRKFHAPKQILEARVRAQRLGYKEAAAIAQQAHRSSKTVREMVLEKKLIPEAELDALLDLTAMTRPGIREGGGGG